MAATNTAPSPANADVLESVHVRFASMFADAAAVSADLTISGALAPRAEPALRAWAAERGLDVEQRCSTSADGYAYRVVVVRPYGMSGGALRVFVSGAPS